MGRKEGKLKPLDKTVSAYYLDIKLGNDSRNYAENEGAFAVKRVNTRSEKFKSSAYAKKR